MTAPEVQPGQFVEHSTPGGRGVARRAYGEFRAPRGELASYAFGWTTGTAETAGRVTIGIGAGNPGGGSFHAAIFSHEGSYAMALVDEPFARVPEGGPDLTRAEALAHEDLPFVWFVADEVMYRDPRAWWLRHWVVGTTAVATPEVLEKAEAVLLLQHDDDGVWQAIGSTSAGADGGVVHLSHLVDEDPTLVPVLDLAPAQRAIRPDATSPWERRSPDADDRPTKRRWFGKGRD